MLGLVLVLSLLAGSRSFAQDNPTTAEVIQMLETDQLAMTQPSGLAYVPQSDSFVLLDAAAPGAFTRYDPATNQAVSLSGGPTPAVPINVTYDGSRQRLLVLDAATGELVAATVAAEQAALTITDRYNMAGLNLQQPAGLTVDDTSGALFILDSATNKVTRIAPGGDGSFESTAALNEGRVSQIDLSALGASGLRGLALNPATGDFYVLDPAKLALYEVSSAGEVVKAHDLQGSGLVSPQGLVFARSGDATDDPSLYDLYIADRGSSPQAPANPDPASFANRLYMPLVQGPDLAAASAAAASATDAVPGKVFEIALDQPQQPQLQAAASTTVLSLVRTTQTWKWSPSSPDPCGITYYTPTGQLIVSDSEVDEISALFTTKKNVFRTTLAGSLQGTMSTVTPLSFSNEPTGVSYNPSNGHLFYSDDDKLKIFEVAPGTDGVLSTSDDKVTSFSVTPFSGRDSEDVNYDLVTPGLWIIDGTNAEAYHLLPGPDGKFDGVPPGGDDILDHFDTKVLGIIDPEGIYRDPASRNLFITSKDPTKVWEVSTGGSLVRIYDVSAAKAVKLAGVTLAPSSTTAGATSLYLVDRVVDNNVDSSENDGRMYEFALSGGSVPTATPTATPAGTPTPTPAPGSQLNFSPNGDTFVRSDFPSSNYSTNAALRVVGSPIINTYLKFNVTGLSGAPHSAKVRLYVTDASTSGGSIYSVSNNYSGTTTPWTESGLKYSNAPAIGGSPLSSVGGVTVGAWVEFNVTSAINGDGTYSFALASTSSNSVLYSSMNAGTNTPVLVIQP